MIARILRWGSLGVCSLLLAGAPAFACACGCGVFDIGNVFRSAPGGSMFAEYDFMNQTQNWHGLSRAPAADNDDKNIRTSFFTFGGQYLLGSGFGVMAELPVWSRHFETTDNGTPKIVDGTALGDIRVTAVYSGLSDDLGTGFTLGVKLPTGDNGGGFDHDTAIGTGSTDLLIGAYRQGTLDTLGSWSYVLQARYQTAFTTRDGYRPGDELDAVAAVSYDAGLTGIVDWRPFLQLIGGLRRHDSGIAADPENSGYSRVLLAPGIETAFASYVLHAEVNIPVYQNVIGNQLVAPVLFKTSIAYDF